MIDDWASYALVDFVPFTAEVYTSLIERVNAAWWPLHLPFAVLGLAALALAWRDRARPALLLLAPAWVFCGLVFHLRYHVELTWAAPWFGGAFLAQAAVLLGVALSARAPESGPRRGPLAGGGAVIALYALVGQPALTGLAGPGWRTAEVFALHPDPTAIATLGVAMVALRGVHAGLVAALPLLWLVLATLTLVALGVAWAWVPAGAVTVALVSLAVSAMTRPPDDLQ